jgi:C-terminal processing protease CtpA/Prc
MVGVLRIPSYSPTDVPKAVKDFAGIIQRMQKFTSALVIDQNNNPGGSVFYLYTLVSMLTEQAAVVPKHRVSLLASDIAGDLNVLTQLESVKTEEEAQKVLGGDNLHGYPVTFQLAMAIRDHLNFVMDEYKTGKQLSNPTVLWGVEKINPHKNAVYTKPVVILVNALDFSGGDFFPAILQDNKRVTVVGTRTAGAGGYVLQVNFPNNLGLSRLSFTGSIAERVDLSPIENLGVTPDVELAITVEDIRKGYGPYLKAVKEIIKAQIK